MRNTLKEILVFLVFYILFSVGNGTFDFTRWNEKRRLVFCVCGSIMYLAMILGG